MTDQPAPETLRDQYATAINAKIDGTAGCANGHRLADAVLAVRDQEMEQLRDERERYFHFACAARGASGAPDFPDLTDTILALLDRAEQAEADRDELHAALGLARGQLHSVALSAIRGRGTNVRELAARAEQAEADLARVQQVACSSAENLRHAEDRIAELEAATTRVKAVHRVSTLHDVTPGQAAYCVNCRFAWPCPTTTALDQPQQPTTAESS